ncbi:MAG TPA: hypothetical protein VF421_09020 [Niabella sp.]
MSLLSFDRFVQQQISNVIENAHANVYQLDDILDMMNSEMIAPGKKAEHQVLVPVGRWICYYLVDHPNKGRCHYFQIQPDASGKLPDRSEMEHLIHAFEIELPLKNEHILVDEENNEVKISLPFESQADTI